LKRLLRSAKFWTAVTGAVVVVSAKLNWKFTAEELAVLISPFALVIGAIMAEDVASSKKKAGDDTEA
jgi:general stress protein CsbA